MFKKLFAKIRISRKKAVLIMAVLGIAALSAAGFYAYGHFFKEELTIGIITDIHAGDQKYRDDGDEPTNNLFPANYEKNMRSALDNLKDADLVLTLGDNMNKGGRKHARKLKELSTGFPMVWTKGNHDKKNEFMEILSEKTYYYVDRGAWRVIVIDNSETRPDAIEGIEEHGRGYIDQAQMDWLKEALKTRRHVIVTMHVPMFRRGNLDEVRPDYAEIQKIFEESGNVKHVFSGHFHIVNMEKEINGLRYHIVPSLSLENHEGRFKKINIDY